MKKNLTLLFSKLFISLISTNNCSFLESKLQKIKTRLLLSLFAVSSFNVFAQNTSLISACSDFDAGPNTIWTHVLIATTPADSAASQGAQTFTMNIIDTANGANVRVAKTTANGNWFFGNPVALTLGSNSITVSAVTFDRAVKFQFSSGDVEFDALSLNGVSSTCVSPLPPPTSSLISACDDFVAGPNATWPHVLVATTIADGAASQGAQTFTMNVVDTANGANVRVYKTTSNGQNFFGNPVALTLGSNSITVPPVTFDRAVKFQFSSGDVEFDALSLNGEDSECVCVTSSFTDVVEACDSYTWIDGNTYTSSNNTATDTLINAAGCDSVVTLDLTITSLNAAVDIINNSTLQVQSVVAGTIYQWVDCNDNFTPIVGETNTTFTPQNPGYYAVELTLNNCSVISDCFTITSTTGIDFLDTQYKIQLFPNPTINNLTISFEGIDFVDVIVVDIQGRVLLQKLGLFDQERINLSAFVAGTYFVKIITPEGSREICVTKQ